MANQLQRKRSDAECCGETGKNVVPLLSCVLTQLIAKTDKINVPQHMMTKFHALRAPNISIVDYLCRISKYAACSNECFVLALIYIDRAVKRNNGFIVTSLNVHRLLISSVMLAAKFFDDHYYNNAYFAKVGGVPTAELNALEAEFLSMLNFRLHVRSSVFEQYRKEIMNHAYVGGHCDCCLALTSSQTPSHPTVTKAPFSQHNGPAAVSSSACIIASSNQFSSHAVAC
eukprot:GILK01003954.1.p1 GENE.GILK01003954.1~~GILK01003954.1.p1  ORF type:complete len:229 (-),score=14.68 GILK01003954.1:156-842(-)